MGSSFLPLRALFLFSALFFVDRATKIAALFLFSDRAHTLFPGFLQFSLFMHTREFLFFNRTTLSWIGGSFLFFLCVLLLFFAKKKYAPSLFFSTVVAVGVASNVLDSIRYGSIIDWIEIPGITFFNLSDVFIIGGCIGLCRMFFFKQPKG
ncbi:MAG: signal peptidase II [Candidatus Uhrbacteria bacterium]|nr:signal peptidase II [Candidatus Uhrbacteria bacterium]